MPKHQDYKPLADVIAEFPDISGNEVNGLGEADPRTPSCFFWHPPEKQTHGRLQAKVLEHLFIEEDVSKEYAPVIIGGSVRGPDAIDRATVQMEKSADEWTALVREFALANEADVVGVTLMQDDYLFEGYEIKEQYVIIVGVAHDYEIMKTAPASPGNTGSASEVGRQYNRGARAVHKLRNYILPQGHQATAYPGPRADALNMLPAAIDCGLGELGKHGSLINRELGSSFRLAALATDMPLICDEPDILGVDDFCMTCQVCMNACPPKAFHDEKKMVRGALKWYVDFDKCIPFFAEAYGCGACIVACPWSRPGVAENMVAKLAKRRAKAAPE